MPRLGRKRSNRQSELDILASLAPVALVGFHPGSGAISFSNSLASELSGYTPKELAGRNILSIFPELDLSRLNRDPSPGDRLALAGKDTSRLLVEIRLLDQAGDTKRWYLGFLPTDDALLPWDPGRLAGDDPARVGQLQRLASKPSDEVYTQFAEIFEQNNLEAGLASYLSFTQAWTQAAGLALFFGQDDKGALDSLKTRGPMEWLPVQLSFQDVIQIQSNPIWQLNRRTPTALHRAARSNGIHTLGCFSFNLPVNNKGILVLALDEAPPEGFAALGGALSRAASTIFQFFSFESDLEALQRKLNQSMSLGNQLMSNIVQGCLVLDASFQILESNPAAERILGYRREQIKKHPVDKVLIGTETLQAAFEQLKVQHGRLEPVEVRLYRRSGEAFLAELSAAPIQLPGEADRILILFQDMTKQELAREQAQQLEQRAILGEITAVFAHEVRNPINNISTGLELLALNAAQDDPALPTINRLIQDCDRLADLMKSILSYTRPVDYTLSLMQLEPFLTNLLERMRPRLERSKISGSLQIQPGLPPVYGSPRALEQVFANLMNNAMQAMSESGGELVLKLQRASQSSLTNLNDPSRFLEVSVIDTGPGIPKEIQERLFQPFFTTNSSGTGLGLAIAKRIITAHRGHIRVNSFPGGTVFQVLLPISPENGA
ncbi:MAG: ATP-binding protein [Anaerolineales bacterium]|nr:ATP-binding protein [Anaerolineales bacterium]